MKKEWLKLAELSKTCPNARRFKQDYNTLNYLSYPTTNCWMLDKCSVHASLFDNNSYSLSPKRMKLKLDTASSEININGYCFEVNGGNLKFIYL